jgi:hypothetical protein
MDSGIPIYLRYPKCLMLASTLVGILAGLWDWHAPKDGAASITELTNALYVARSQADVDAFFKYYYTPAVAPDELASAKNWVRGHWEDAQGLAGKAVASMKVCLTSEYPYANVELLGKNRRKLQWVAPPTHFLVFENQDASDEHFALLEKGHRWFLASAKYAD